MTPASEPPLEQIDSEQSYMASITDLMTGVVFVFVLLLASYALVLRAKEKAANADLERARKAEAAAEVAKSQAEKSQAEAERSKAEADKSLSAAKTAEQKAQSALGRNKAIAAQLDKLASLLKDREQDRRNRMEKLAASLKSRGVNVRMDIDNGIISLPERLLFDTGQAELRPEGRTALTILGEELETSLADWCEPRSIFRLESLFIEGHTDNVPINNGVFHNNWELSAARSVNTNLQIISAAPALAGFANPARTPVVGVSAYGENRPVASNFSEEGRGKNRRIDLRFIPSFPTAEQFGEVRAILEDSPGSPPSKH